MKDRFVELTEARISRGLFFTWFTDTLAKGFESRLKLSDLHNLPDSLRSNSYTLSDFQSTQQSIWSDDEKYNHFFNVLLRRHWLQFIALGFFKFLCTLSSFLGPVLLGLMVTYVGSVVNPVTGRDVMYGVLLASGLTLSLFLSAALNTTYNIRGNLLQIRLKSALTMILFHQSLSFRAYEWTDIQLHEAKLTTLVQVDVECVSSCVKSLHDLWALPLQLIVAFVLLYLQVEIGFLAGLAIIIIMIPINTFIAKMINQATTKMMIHKDKRVKVLTEAVRGMKSIKMLNLETCILERSDIERHDEVIWLSQRKYLDAACVFLWASMPVLVPCITFIAAVLFNTPMSNSQIFTALALLGMLVFPMNAFPWVINGAIEARVSARRLAAVLAHQGEHQFKSVDEGSEFGTPKTNPDFVELKAAKWVYPPQNIVSANGCYHSKGSLAQNSLSGFEIGPISFRFESGFCYAVTGGVGCGKTGLLLGMLGELHSSLSLQSNSPKTEDSSATLMQQSVARSSSSRWSSENHTSVFAYCAQTPSMHSGSVRDNILMGQPFDIIRYREVITGCQLLADMKSDNWPLEDLTPVGEAGGNLSGGQRQRIGVARAVYSRAPVLLLDDPLASLDLSTADALATYLIEVVSKLQRRLIIVTTQSEKMINLASYVLTMDRGQILNAYSSASRTHTEEAMPTSNIVDCENVLHVSDNHFKVSPAVATLAEAKTPKDNDAVGSEKPLQLDDINAQEDEEALEYMESGKISIDVYLAYFRCAGSCVSLAVLLSTFVMQISSTLMALWWSEWAGHIGSYSKFEFIKITTVIASINIFCALGRSYLFAYAGLRAAKVFYNDLINAVFSTTLSFFETTSLGKIVNRFGKDTFCIDDQLPFMMNIVLAQVFLLLGSFAIMAFTDPIVIVVIVVVGVAYYRLQRFYRSSSRLLRRLDSAYRSPVFSVFCDCCANAICIRSLGKAVQNHFEILMQDVLDDSQRVFLSLCVANQWLGIRLQLMGCLVTFSLALSAVFFTTTGFVPVSPSLLGLALTYSLTVVGNLNGLVGSLAETEQEMISVERVRQFTVLPHEDTSVGFRNNNATSGHRPTYASTLKSRELRSYHLLDVSDDLEAPLVDRDSESESVRSSTTALDLHENSSGTCQDIWPRHGTIIFSQVSMRYAPQLPYSLQNISVTINSGSRVAVVGRTGSGKSSLLRVLLRLCTFEGSVFIDGKDTKDMTLQILRSAITVIPQDPFLFTGTVRLNLDPQNQYSDDCLIRALRKCKVALSLHHTYFKTISKAELDLLPNRRQDDDCLRCLLDHELHDAGANLSQGQRQLFSLGRAMASLDMQSSSQNKAQIVLIDEATAALDSTIEESLVDAVSALLSPSRNRQSVISAPITVIMICHKPAGLKQLCSKELRLSAGTIESFHDIVPTTLLNDMLRT